MHGWGFTLVDVVQHGYVICQCTCRAIKAMEEKAQDRAGADSLRVRGHDNSRPFFGPSH